MMTDRQKAIETLAELISKTPVAMLTTCLPDHTLRSRPMVNVNQKFDGSLWFFTPQDDPKVREIVGNPQVNVAFADPHAKRYVSISGCASVVNDRRRAELLWTDACSKWLPQGPDDPQLALLKVEADSAEFWEEKKGAMMGISGFLKRKVAGGSRSVEHDKIEWEML